MTALPARALAAAPPEAVWRRGWWVRKPLTASSRSSHCGCCRRIPWEPLSGPVGRLSGCSRRVDPRTTCAGPRTTPANDPGRRPVLDSGIQMNCVDDGYVDRLGGKPRSDFPSFAFGATGSSHGGDRRKRVLWLALLTSRTVRSRYGIKVEGSGRGSGIAAHRSSSSNFPPTGPRRRIAGFSETGCE